MALRCSHEDHPVGTGSFCRICGRDYVEVPDPVPALVSVAAPSAVADVPTQVLPTGPREHTPTPAFEPPVVAVPPGFVPPVRAPDLADLAALLPSQPDPLPADRTAAPEAAAPAEHAAAHGVAGEVDHELAHEVAEEHAAHARSRSSLSDVAASQPALLAVAGFGGGALVMALLDRLVL